MSALAPESLQGYDIKELVSELRRRGYRVAKEDRIRTASTQISVSVNELIRLDNDGGFLNHVHDNLGRNLGTFLMRSGAVPVRQEIGYSEHHRLYRASVMVVVDDPQFDWPYPLRMEK